MTHCYTASEIEDILTELDYTNELCNRLFSAKDKIDEAISFNIQFEQGLMSADKSFADRLTAVSKEIESLNNIAISIYGKTYREFVNDLANRRVNE